MRIADTYSSWCRNLLTREDREAIATAGDGDVRFSRPRGQWAATITTDAHTAVGFGPTPGAAFRAARANLAAVAA